MKPKVTIILNKKVSEVSDSCPTATVDIEENSKNRNWTIDNFGYGPLNPDMILILDFGKRKLNYGIVTLRQLRLQDVVIVLHLIRQIKLWNVWSKVLTKLKLQILMMF